MLTDAQLAWVVGCKPKWIYNASQRIGRPIERTPEDARWWRLTHHLSQLLGIVLARAAAGADTILGMGMDAGRVRVGNTPDEAVSVSVDIGRFHDGASLALAAALEVVQPRRRGRPRKGGSRRSAGGSSPEASARPIDARRDEARDAVLVEQGFRELPRPDAAPEAHEIVTALASLGLDPVVGGFLASRLADSRAAAGPLVLHIRSPGRADARLATLLNVLGARPRGVWSREAFSLDSCLVRSVPALVLDLRGVPVLLARSRAGGVDHDARLRTALRVPGGPSPVLVSTIGDDLYPS